MGRLIVSWPRLASTTRRVIGPDAPGVSGRCACAPGRAASPAQSAATTATRVMAQEKGPKMTCMILYSQAHFTTRQEPLRDALAIRVTRTGYRESASNSTRAVAQL